MVGSQLAEVGKPLAKFVLSWGGRRSGDEAHEFLGFVAGLVEHGIQRLLVHVVMGQHLFLETFSPRLVIGIGQVAHVKDGVGPQIALRIVLCADRRGEILGQFPLATDERAKLGVVPAEFFLFQFVQGLVSGFRLLVDVHIFAALAGGDDRHAEILEEAGGETKARLHWRVFFFAVTFTPGGSIIF